MINKIKQDFSIYKRRNTYPKIYDNIKMTTCYNCLNIIYEIENLAIKISKLENKIKELEEKFDNKINIIDDFNSIQN